MVIKKEVFYFKEFAVRHRDSGMKVGQDSILLGAWAPMNDCITVLDIGCGTGLLSLQLAQRFPMMKIDAVEIDQLAWSEACYNVQKSPWPDRIRVYQRAIQDYLRDRIGGYDGLICNPPYFSDGIKPEQKQRLIARHQSTLSHDDLLMAASKLLKPAGKFCLIIPTSSCQSFLSVAQSYGFFPEWVVRVFADHDKPSKRSLLLLVNREVLVDRSRLLLFDRGVPTMEYRNLVRQFYLNVDSLNMT